MTKRDGTRQAFDRKKLSRGIQLACRKRPVSDEEIEHVVQSIERWAGTRGDRDVPADHVGERVDAVRERAELLA
ncbi:MAG: ATP cone domain-containing protein, partial [Nannocystaceae bacterium]